MQATRKKIIDHLFHNPEASAGDLGRVLEMTPANIRYHLGILLENNQVQISGQRPAGGSGRPLYLYNLSSETLGDNLLTLLDVLFETLEEQKESEKILESIATKLAKSFLPDNVNLITRYNAAVDHLNKLNYHASWDASPEGPRVALRHCPYRDLALSHPQICQVDQILLSGLFQIPLHLTQRRRFGSNPFSRCIFNPAQDQKEKG